MPAALLDGEDGSPTASASDVDTAADAVITVLHDEGGGSGRLGGALPMGGGDVFLDVNCCEAVKLEPSAADLLAEGVALTWAVAEVLSATSTASEGRSTCIGTHASDEVASHVRCSFEESWGLLKVPRGTKSSMLLLT